MRAEERTPVPEDTTPESAAAAFEANDYWPIWSRDGCPVGSNDAWAKEHVAMAPTLRLAWLTLTKTKPEVLQIVADLDDDKIEEVLDKLDAAASFLNAIGEMAMAARARLFLAWGARIAALSAEAR